PRGFERGDRCLDQNAVAGEHAEECESIIESTVWRAPASIVRRAIAPRLVLLPFVITLLVALFVIAVDIIERRRGDAAYRARIIHYHVAFLLGSSPLVNAH